VVRRIVPTSVDEREVVLGALEAVLETLPALLRQTSDAQARVPGRGEDGWSVAEAISHLIDGENRTSERSRRMLREENPLLPVYPDDDYSPLPLSDLVEKFSSLRRDHVRLLRQVLEADWNRPGQHELYGQISIAFQARMMACHDAEHLAQIARKLR